MRLHQAMGQAGPPTMTYLPESLGRPEFRGSDQAADEPSDGFWISPMRTA